jgi:hypothetical protein
MHSPVGRSRTALSDGSISAVTKGGMAAIE